MYFCAISLVRTRAIADYASNVLILLRTVISYRSLLTVSTTRSKLGSSSDSRLPTTTNRKAMSTFILPLSSSNTPGLCTCTFRRGGDVEITMFEVTVFKA